MSVRPAASWPATVLTIAALLALIALYVVVFAAHGIAR